MSFFREIILEPGNVMGLSAPRPDSLFLLIEKGSKKIKACTTSFSLPAKFILFATGGAQGDLLKYFRSFPSPLPPSTTLQIFILKRAMHCFRDTGGAEGRFYFLGNNSLYQFAS